MTIRVQAPAIFKVHKDAKRMASRSAWPEGASQDSRRQQDAVVNKSEESEDITEDKEPKEESEESRHAEKDGVSNGAFSMSSVERCELSNNLPDMSVDVEVGSGLGHRGIGSWT